jgi:hypothetical protein
MFLDIQKYEHIQDVRCRDSITEKFSEDSINYHYKITDLSDELEKFFYGMMSEAIRTKKIEEFNKNEDNRLRIEYYFNYFSIYINRWIYNPSNDNELQDGPSKSYGDNVQCFLPIKPNDYKYIDKCFRFFNKMKDILDNEKRFYFEIIYKYHMNANRLYKIIDK